MQKIAKKTLSPQKAKTTKTLCSLNRDNFDVPSGWILIDEDRVYIRNQESGNPSTGKVEFSKKDFNRIVKWYTTPQVVRSNKGGKK